MKYTLAFLFVAATAILMISASSPPQTVQFVPPLPTLSSVNSVLRRARRLAKQLREAQAAPSPPTYQQLRGFVQEFVQVSGYAAQLARQIVAAQSRDAHPLQEKLEEVQRLLTESAQQIVAALPAGEIDLASRLNGARI